MQKIYSENDYSDAEVYDPNTDTWTMLPNMNYARKTPEAAGSA